MHTGDDISVSQTSTILLRELSQRENSEVWTRFVAFWRPRLQVALSRLGVRGTDSEDAVQAALANIHAALRHGRYQRSRGRLSAWMYSIAVRAALDAKRRDARYIARVKSVMSSGDVVQDAPAAIPPDDLRTLLDRARSLAASDPRDAAVFESLLVGNAAPQDVARELGVSVEHLYLVKHRLIRRLRETIPVPRH